MRILWLASAELDLESLTDYIALEKPQTALRIFLTIRRSVEKLDKYPLTGREGRIADTRELVIPHLPLIVVYRITTDILILAILHTSRKWPKTKI